MAWLRRRGRVYYLRWRGEDGKERTQAVGRDKTEARIALKKLEAELLEGQTAPRLVSLAKFITEWHERRVKAGHIRAKTQETEERLIRLDILPHLGSTPMARLTVEQVEEWITDLTTRKGPHTANRAHDVLRACLEDAKRYERIRQNPAMGAKRARIEEEPVRAPSVEDACRILKAIPRRYAPQVFAAMLTGLRWGELAGLHWEDFDRDAGRLHVRRQIASSTSQEAPPKSRAGLRSVDLLPPVWNLLMDRPERGTYIFPGMQGEHDYHNFNGRVWSETVKDLGLDVRFHDLRHLFASLLFAWGEPPLYVAAQMGHGSADVTLKVYAHLLREGRKLDREATLAKLAEAANLRSTFAVQETEEALHDAITGPQVVETSGFEPPTPSLRTRCSPS